MRRCVGMLWISGCLISTPSLRAECDARPAEAWCDPDGDLVPNQTDVDDDGDGILDTEERSAWSASDPTVDLDVDADGIPDAVEAAWVDLVAGRSLGGGAPGDSILGLDDVYGSGLVPLDTDGDGTADPYDSNADDDDNGDRSEVGLSPLALTDRDGDGLDDASDPWPCEWGPALFATRASTEPCELEVQSVDLLIDDDGDGIPVAWDRYDGDGDNDGVPDDLECAVVPCAAKGCRGVDETGDDDNDGLCNDVDLDDDDDGLNDDLEAARGTDPRSFDTDGDGMGDGDEVLLGTDPLLGVLFDVSGNPGDILAGGSHFCAFTHERTVVCWGDDTVGQASPPLDVPFSSFDIGAEHGCGVTLDGGIRCWGADTFGQATPPEPVPGARFLDVATRGQSSCGLLSAGGNTGSVVCWGEETDLPSDHGLADDGYTTIATSGAWTCALDTEGIPSCWYSQPRNGIPNMEPYREEPLVALVGGAVLCGVTDNGAWPCWAAPFGYAPSGQQPGYNDASVVSVGGSSFCLIGRAGTVQCWGYGRSGSGLLAPSPNPATGFVNVALGVNGCGIRESGGVDCWLGDAEADVVVPPFGSDVVLVDESCLLLANGRLTCVGELSSDITTGVEDVDLHPDGLVCTLTAGGFPECRTPGDARVRVFDTSGQSYRSVAAGRDFGCGVSAAGTVHCWAGQFKEAPTLKRASNVVDLAAGDEHVCALNGNGRIDCSGSASPLGTFTALGAGTEWSCAIRASDLGLECWDQAGNGEPAPAGRYQSIALSRSFACATHHDGYAVCWSRYLPGKPEITDGDFAMLSPSHSQYDACGLEKTGHVRCWEAGSTTRYVRF